MKEELAVPRELYSAWHLPADQSAGGTSLDDGRGKAREVERMP